MKKLLGLLLIITLTMSSCVYGVYGGRPGYWNYGSARCGYHFKRHTYEHRSGQTYINGHGHGHRH